MDTKQTIKNTHVSLNLFCIPSVVVKKGSFISRRLDQHMPNAFPEHAKRKYAHLRVGTRSGRLFVGRELFSALLGMGDQQDDAAPTALAEKKAEERLRRGLSSGKSKSLKVNIAAIVSSNSCYFIVGWFWSPSLERCVCRASSSGAVPSCEHLWTFALL